MKLVKPDGAWVCVQNNAQVVKCFLGTGLTVVGSEDPADRYLFILQMMFSITRGIEFLGFPTEQRGCLYVASRAGDYQNIKQSKAFLEKRNHVKADYLKIADERYKNLSGISYSPYLDYLGDKYPYFVVLFLGDYNDELTPTIDDYMLSDELKNLGEHLRIENGLSLEHIHAYGKRRDITYFHKLKDLSWNRNICLILGDDLNSKGKLGSSSSTRYANHKIFLKQNKDNVILHTEGWARIHRTMKIVLVRTEGGFFDLHPDERKKHMRIQGLTDNMEKIVNLLRDNGPTKFNDIVKQTGIGKSSLHNALKALSEGRAGFRVLKESNLWEVVETGSDGSVEPNG